MKPLNFYKNQFRSQFTYADAVKYVGYRTVRSVNLITPEEQAQRNYERLRYEQAKRDAEAMERKAARLTVMEVLKSFAILAAMLGSSILVITHYSH